MVGKIILPWFGGISSVWSTLLLFFIVTLFLGYLYTYLLEKAKPITQTNFHHATILTVGLVLLLTTIRNHNLFPTTPPNLLNLFQLPYAKIIILSIITIGGPTLLLSTSSTLLQFWFSKQHPKQSPYTLYQLSNAGSIAGLLFYPFILEPHASLKNQQIVWLLIFGVFLLLYGYIAIKIRKNLNSQVETTRQTINTSTYLKWVGLSLIPNILLISTTTYITQSIAPSPFMWLLPLLAYLLSYVLAFSDLWYEKKFHSGMLYASIFVVFCILDGYINVRNYYLEISILIFCQFITSFICHSELYLLRPKTNLIPSFYLSIALGGVIGSVLCSILAPTLFNDFWEYPIALSLAVFMYLLITFKSISFHHQAEQLLLTSILFFLVYKYFSTPLPQQGPNTRIITSQRNFYGSVKIAIDRPSDPAIRGYAKTLTNGQIVHGIQEFDTPNTFIPTSYYSPSSGIGVYTDNFTKQYKSKPKRWGLIGLGIGSLTGYCQNGDYYRFYEINPIVISLAKQHFTLIQNCESLGGHVDIVEGDARMLMSSEIKQSPQMFDVLVVDAFNDDAIPMHLITSEAVDLYLQHLNSEGVVAFHTSNMHLDLNAVLNAISFQKQLYTYNHLSQYGSWYFISKKQLSLLPFQLVDQSKVKSSVWTDSYNNLLEVIKPVASFAL